MSKATSPSNLSSSQKSAEFSCKPNSFNKIQSYLQKKIREFEHGEKEKNPENEEISKIAKKLNQGIYQMLDNHLIISLSGFDANPGVVSLIWKVISTLPYLSRYKLYENWFNNNVRGVHNLRWRSTQ